MKSIRSVRPTPSKIPVAVQQGVNLIKNPKATRNKTNAAGEGETSPARLLYRNKKKGKQGKEGGATQRVTETGFFFLQLSSWYVR